jgi:hypothetical protein
MTTISPTAIHDDVAPSVTAGMPRPTAKSRPAPVPQHAVSKTYVAAWACIGGLSSAYLAAAVLNPDLLAELTQNPVGQVQEASSPTGLVRQTLANVQTLQKTVSALAGDVAQLKSAAQTQTERQIETGARVAHIESRLSGISAAAPIVPGSPRVARTTEVTPLEPIPVSAAVTPAAKLADQMANAAPAELVAKPVENKNQARLGAPPAGIPGMIVQTTPLVTSPPPTAVVRSAPPPAEARASRQALQDQVQPPVQLMPSSIETGGISRLGAQPVAAQAPAAAVSPPVAAGPVAVSAAKSVAQAKPRTATAVQIAAGPSVDALRLSWMLLSDRHSNVLKQLEPRFVSDEPGVYRLVAGPFASPAEAQRACADLKARGASCQTSDFGGEAL